MYDILTLRTQSLSRPTLWVPHELEEVDGVLKVVQPGVVHDVSDEEAKEVHLGSEDDIDEDLADRMDECEV